MPTAYILAILAPQTQTNMYPLQPRMDEKIIRAYFQSNTFTNVKVCYVSQDATPHLTSHEFIASMQYLLEGIHQDDWLVIIYTGVYAKISEQTQENTLTDRSTRHHHHCGFLVPFSDDGWLSEHVLASHINYYYSRNHFKTLLILQAYLEGIDLRLHHPSWGDIQVVALLGERCQQPLISYDFGGLFIKPLFNYLSDIEINLKRLERTPPSLQQVYTVIKGRLKEEGILSSSDSDSQSEDEEDNFDDSDTEKEEKTLLRLFYSERGKDLLNQTLPL